VKISGKEKKEFHKFVYLGSVVEKNGKIQNEKNEKTGKASEFYHLAKTLLRNKDINNKCKITIFNVYFKKIYYKEQRLGHVLRQRKAN
jgi:hypothetical protein